MNPLELAQAAPARELGGPGRLKERVDYTRWLLWGGLILGVLVLASMAYRLWRQMRLPEQPAAS